MSVEIVLASYNGGSFIQQQLESLLAQTYSDILLLIGDDGSTDETLAIIATYVERFPGRIRLLVPAHRLGVCGNFSRLLAATTADYVFLADQDDVWDCDKVAASMDAMRSLENQHGTHMPLLVHSDLRVVDAELHPISSSFFDLQRLNRFRSDFRDLLFQNNVTGCASLVNRALVEKALPIPPGVIAHDWWLAVVASAFGHIHFINRSLISYRQHSCNQVGAKGWSARYLRRQLAQLVDKRQAGDLGYPVILQADAFGRRFGNELSSIDRKIVDQVRRFDKCSGVSRVIRAAKLRARKHGLLRTIALYWLLLRADFSHRGCREIK